MESPTPFIAKVDVNAGRQEQPDHGSFVDRAQIARLITTKYSGLVSLVYRRTRNRELASDLVNEAIAIALEHAKAGRLTQPERIGGYVFRVSMNLLRNQSRNFDNREDMRSSTEVMELLSACDSDGIEAAQVQKTTLRVLKSLPSARDREVIKRFYLDEEDKQAICKELGLTALQFTQVMSRARQRMRTLFESEGLTRSDLLSLLCVTIIFLSGWHIF